MSLLRPAGTLTAGADPVRLGPGAAGWTYSGLQVLTLAPGTPRTLDLHDAEGAVVPLSGGCVVDIDDGPRFELTGRTSVFSAPTDLCYLPPGASVTLTSPGGGEIAVPTAVADEHRPAFYRAAEETAVEIRGAGQATRQINNLLSAEVEGPQRLIVVEVLTPASNWSSYPPHKHDEWSATEVPLEEIYYFRVSDERGFGVHRTYTVDGDIDETVTVGDGDVFLIPRGFHGPCVAAPGYDMYYLNVMAGPDTERRWLISTDPDHAWLVDAWAEAATDPRVPMYGEETA